jgi:hypothetical protein
VLDVAKERIETKRAQRAVMSAAATEETDKMAEATAKRLVAGEAVEAGAALDLLEILSFGEIVLAAVTVYELYDIIHDHYTAESGGGHR